jgi:hypothetical protein
VWQHYTEAKNRNTMKANILGTQNKTIFDRDFDIEGSGLPHEMLGLRTDAAAILVVTTLGGLQEIHFRSNRYGRILSNVSISS